MSNPNSSADPAPAGILRPPGIEEIAADMKQVRRDIHQHPELAFQEHRTSDLVARRLIEWGFDVTRSVGGTGLVGQLRCGTGNRSIGIRADMDALPIAEQTGVPHASVHSGVMHACGHDGHTAMLLGAARHLSLTRRFSGTLNLIFQPAEEKGFGSGATAMVQDGLFERFPCDRIYAIHNLPGVAIGTFLFRTGAFMAAGDRVFVRVLGKGAHAARPHHSVDPIVIASEMVLSLQTVVARGIDPEEAAVVTVSRFKGGDALNVIPDRAELGLSVRTFSDAVRGSIKERILRLVQGVAAAHGGQVEVDYIEGYPVVVNDEASTVLAEAVACDLFGADKVVRNAPRSMGSEDFSYMLQRVPGAMIRLGNGAAGSPGLHTAHYDFNDENLLHGIRFWSSLVEAYLTDAALA